MSLEHDLQNARNNHDPAPAASEAEQFIAEHIESLRTQLACRNNSENLMLQAKGLAALIANLAESPNQIEHELIGTAGCLMEDLLLRLELALLKEEGQEMFHE